MTSNPNKEIDLNTTQARQGTDRPKLIYVLIAGVVLVIVAFALVWMFTKR